MRTIALLFLSAGLYAQQSPLAREGSYWLETSSGTVASSVPASIKIVTRGNVVLRGGAGNQLTYTLRKRAQGAESDARRLFAACRVSVRNMGGAFHVELESPGNRVAPELDLHLPSQLSRAEVQTLWGSIRIDQVSGDTVASTGGGPINADHVAGSLTVRTGGGDIHLGSVGGLLHANTGGGPIHVERAGSESWLETGGGEITVTHASGPVHASTGAGNIQVNHAETEVFARTNGGVIAVNQAGGEVKAENSAGAIRVSSARGVRCESAAGTIRLRDVSGELKAVTAVGSILAELLSGGRLGNSLLSTNSGDITVWIPSNLAVTVQALNESAGLPGRIVSEFSEIQVQPGGGRDRGRTLASGTINGGGPLLKLAASQGTIYLRRR